MVTLDTLAFLAITVQFIFVNKMGRDISDTFYKSGHLLKHNLDNILLPRRRHILPDWCICSTRY